MNTSSFRDNLLSMIATFQSYKNPDKKELLNNYVKSRLQDRVKSYNDEMRLHLESLSTYNGLRVLKKINRGLKNGI